MIDCAREFERAWQAWHWPSPSGRARLQLYHSSHHSAAPNDRSSASAAIGPRKRDARCGSIAKVTAKPTPAARRQYSGAVAPDTSVSTISLVWRRHVRSERAQDPVVQTDTAKAWCERPRPFRPAMARISANKRNTHRASNAVNCFFSGLRLSLQQARNGPTRSGSCVISRAGELACDGAALLR
jgi:hypothetical protein